MSADTSTASSPPDLSELAISAEIVAAENALDAAHRFDVVSAGCGPDRAPSVAVERALVALAAEYAARLVATSDLRLAVGTNGETLLAAPAVPSGRSLAGPPDALGLYVLGAYESGPFAGIRNPVDPADLTPGPAHLRTQATDCADKLAGELFNSEFGQLVATVALSRFDLPLTLGGTEPTARRSE